MSFATALWRAIFSRRAPRHGTTRGLPAGWRVVEDPRDIFAEYCTEFMKEDLLLWEQIVMPASGSVANQLAFYAATWDFLSDPQRLDAQTLLKGVKGAYVKALSLRESMA